MRATLSSASSQGKFDQAAAVLEVLDQDSSPQAGYGEAAQLLSLLNQKKVPARTLKRWLDSGILADLLDSESDILNRFSRDDICLRLGITPYRRVLTLTLQVDRKTPFNSLITDLWLNSEECFGSPGAIGPAKATYLLLQMRRTVEDPKVLTYYFEQEGLVGADWRELIALCRLAPEGVDLVRAPGTIVGNSVAACNRTAPGQEKKFRLFDARLDFCKGYIILVRCLSQ